jgi:NAD(P)H-quinone oxidoreductase subunit 5
MSASPFAALAWFLPGALLAAALLVRLRPRQAWPIGTGALLAAPVLAVLAVPALAPANRVMAFLITGIGAITLRFSQRYLDGEPDTARYVHWFLLAISGASLVAVSRDLIVTGLAWTLTSLALHQLLTFGPARAAAEIAAHKKFLLSRVADLGVAAAVLLIGRAYHSTDLGVILESAAAGYVPTAAGVGTTLLALAIVLRSAQLPFHGWLIQVMEAPTPVSALLHAGVVNLGAFVAISLAPLFLATAPAMAVLVAAGALSATLASLTMRTRGSVKGALAWSTCAQMGFVLVEIGLGAFDLALLHIVAHGAYKAHAFLSSGSGVPAAVQRPAAVPAPRGLHWALATVLAPALVVGTALAFWGGFAERQTNIVSAGVLALALMPTVAQLLAAPTAAARRSALAIALGLPALYTLWHAALAPVVPVPAALPLPLWAAALTLAAFAAALTTQAIVAAAPQGTVARRLYPHAAAGFHLDAVFTRLTFRLWPPTITAPAMRQRRERSPLRIERAA